jgi:hypothetical protein
MTDQDITFDYYSYHGTYQVKTYRAISHNLATHPGGVWWPRVYFVDNVNREVKGRAGAGQKIEVFGSTGYEKANIYMGYCTAGSNGDWTFTSGDWGSGITTTIFDNQDFFIVTASDISIDPVFNLPRNQTSEFSTPAWCPDSKLEAIDNCDQDVILNIPFVASGGTINWYKEGTTSPIAQNMGALNTNPSVTPGAGPGRYKAVIVSSCGTITTEWVTVY